MIALHDECTNSLLRPVLDPARVAKPYPLRDGIRISHMTFLDAVARTVPVRGLDILPTMHTIRTDQ